MISARLARPYILIFLGLVIGQLVVIRVFHEDFFSLVTAANIAKTVVLVLFFLSLRSKEISNRLKLMSLVMAVLILGQFIAANLIGIFYTTQEILESFILGSPTGVVGISYVIFGVFLVLEKEVEGRKSTIPGVLVALHGLVLGSFVLVVFASVSQWLLVAGLWYIAERKKEKLGQMLK